MRIDGYTPEEIERYKITRAAEIERILRDAMLRRALVTAYGENNRDYLVTALLAVDPDRNSLYLDAGADPAAVAALMGSTEVTFNTAPDHIRVVFTTPAPTMAELAGRHVLRAEMPGELLRFQRRNYYRLPTSVDRPARCSIAIDGQAIDSIVLDISIGGLGVLAGAAAARLREGGIYRGCRLTLPEAGEHAVDLRICMAYERAVRDGALMRRFGCQFIDLTDGVAADIRRYIVRLERERRQGAN
ncbi:MAG: flagellar brake protein [Gallionellaceae bacterium]|nr:flagellar brake protein [Gallionellaceae bacterium]